MKERGQVGGSRTQYRRVLTDIRKTLKNGEGDKTQSSQAENLGSRRIWEWDNENQIGMRCRKMWQADYLIIKVQGGINLVKYPGSGVVWGIIKL